MYDKIFPGFFNNPSLTLIFMISNISIVDFSRPDTSFTWFRNPLKALKYTIKAHCFKVCCYCCIIIFPTVFFVLFFYAFPGYTAKRILGV